MLLKPWAEIIDMFPVRFYFSISHGAKQHVSESCLTSAPESLQQIFRKEHWQIHPLHFRLFVTPEPYWMSCNVDLQPASKLVKSAVQIPLAVGRVSAMSSET